MNYQRFFRRNADELSKELLGRLLVRNTDKVSIGGKITQIGAYEGGKETKPREGMKYSAGTIFLMPYRGCNLLNIATDKVGYPSCVEIREIAYDKKKIKGPGKISNILKIGEDLDGILLGKELEIHGKSVDTSKIKKISGTTDNCLGYFLIK